VDQAKALYAHGLYCTLACRADRPQELWKEGLARDLADGRTEVAFNGNIVASSTKSKKVVNIISTSFTVSSVEETTVANRRSLLHHYDTTKSPADVFQHLCSTIYYDHCHSEWTVTLLLGWFQFSLTNAYILHKLRTKTPLTHRAFVEHIGISLLSKPQ